jgi:anti-sigma regulatory factor (Ser/Thr protein kinase)
VEADVAGGPDAARRARRLVRHELSDRVSPRVLGDIALLVTELVANGVRHGGAGAGRALHLRLERRERSLRVEVADPGRRRNAIAPRQADLRGGGGLGLQIVEHLSNRWGVDDGPQTRVWFELELR